MAAGQLARRQYGHVTGHAMTTFQKQTDNNNYEHKTDTVKNNQRL